MKGYFFNKKKRETKMGKKKQEKKKKKMKEFSLMVDNTSTHLLTVTGTNCWGINRNITLCDIKKPPPPPPLANVAQNRLRKRVTLSG